MRGQKALRTNERGRIIPAIVECLLVEYLQSHPSEALKLEALNILQTVDARSPGDCALPSNWVDGLGCPSPSREARRHAARAYGEFSA